MLFARPNSSKQSTLGFLPFFAPHYNLKRRGISVRPRRWPKDRPVPCGSQLDFVSYSSLLRKCSKAKDLARGRRVHDDMIRNGIDRDTIVENFLVEMYGKCGAVQDARHWFDQMHQQNVFSWTIMIAAYIQRGHVEVALQLFQQMQQEGVSADKFTLSTILGACARQETLEHGKDIHACIIDSDFYTDVVIMTALINMYGRCGNPESARMVFDRMCPPDTVSYNSMIAAYAQHGHEKKALVLYQQMQHERVKPSHFTFIAILRACSTPEDLPWGREIHSRIVDGGYESDIVKTALVSMYGKCRCLEEALKIFDKIFKQDVVSWNSMIGVYVQLGCGKDAIELYERLQKRGFKPTGVTYAGVLAACSILGAVAKGKEIHKSILDSGLQSDVVLGTALVNMYGKCGNLGDALIVFDNIYSRDVILWNAIIAAYAQNGHSKRALQLFEVMQKAAVKPDEVTFISVLSACSHTGMLSDGWAYFHSMKKDHGITATVKHYACMIDIFGRAGQLEAAEDFIKKMPIEPDAVVWTAFLGACTVHGDAERGKQAAEHIILLDPKIDAPYVLLSNFYAAEGRWDDVANIRKAMEQNVKKKPGCSWIEAQNSVHEFVSGDRSHPQTDQIYAELEMLNWQLKKAGYVPNTKVVFHDVGEDIKETLVCYHSEKLAIAFGLITIPPGNPIRVFKNLRMCLDCHAATKFISKIVEREIIVRDANRFHHFVSGICSCGDYW